MEIHHSSLRTSSASAGSYAAVARVNAVKNNGVANQQRPQSTGQVQTVAAIEQVLQKGADFLNQPYLKDVFNRPVPTQIQHALDAYQNQHAQPWVSQRNALVSGVDFYV